MYIIYITYPSGFTRAVRDASNSIVVYPSRMKAMIVAGQMENQGFMCSIIDVSTETER